MNQRMFPRRWIILVLLLMTSISFLFLQLLSLKAIDNTLISRFRVLESLQRILPYQNHRNVVLKHLNVFTQVSKEVGVPIFLFHPSLSSLSTRDSNNFQDDGNDQCELLCDQQVFIFGVINSEWQKKQSQPLTALIPQFRTDLRSQGFYTACHNVQEPWFDPSKDFLNVNLILSSCSISKDNVLMELSIFYDRKSYLWHGPLEEDATTNFVKYSEGYNRLSLQLPRLLNHKKPYKGVHATGRLMWWDRKLSLCDERDGQVFTTLDCTIPSARGLGVVLTDERTPVFVANRLKM